MSGLFVDNDGKMSWKKFGYRARSAFAVLLSLAVLLGGSGFAVYKVDHAYKAWKAVSDYTGTGGKVVDFEIPKDSTISEIAAVLVRNGVIKSSKAFRNAADGNDDAAKIQAGEYRLPQQIPAATALTMLLDPKNRVVRQVTVPEGMRVSDVLALISKKTGVPLADLQKVSRDKDAMGLPSWASSEPNYPEGFLFPDTYQYDSSPTAAELLPKMTEEFNQVAGSMNFATTAKALQWPDIPSGSITPLEVLSVAAILQAEVPAKYMPQVAGVIYNRVAKNMPLGLDSSLHYALNVPMNKLLPKDATKYASPYNTYLHTGFMPGAMNSPGKVALQAALKPQKTDALYFVTVNLKTGETLFAKDLAGQNANVKKFEAWCKANNSPSGCAK